MLHMRYTLTDKCSSFIRKGISHIAKTSLRTFASLRFRIPEGLPILLCQTIGNRIRASNPSLDPRWIPVRTQRCPRRSLTIIGMWSLLRRPGWGSHELHLIKIFGAQRVRRNSCGRRTCSKACQTCATLVWSTTGG